MGFNIRGLKPSANSRYKQGYFDDYHPVKYFGPRPIIYRSSYELIFMQKIEFNNNVAQWSSENIVIPYLLEEKINGKIVKVRHRYVIDFTVIMKSGQKYAVEVKPLSKSPKSLEQAKRDPEIYKNLKKWQAAIAWCKSNGYEFKVVTENDLRTKVF